MADIESGSDALANSIHLQEAATIPSVYLASIYSLYHIGNLKRGQVRNLLVGRDDVFLSNSCAVCLDPFRLWWRRSVGHSARPIQGRRGETDIYAKLGALLIDPDLRHCGN